MLLRSRAALGRRRGVRPTSHLQGTFRAHVEEGQAAPRRRPQPSSRILTAWKVNSAKSAGGGFAKWAAEILMCVWLVLPCVKS
jgi:hypothetical protein